MARSKFNKNRKHKKYQSGGRVSLPIEYFGGNSGRYFPEGSPELVPANSAYGNTFATSHGTQIGNNMMGPDLGPYPNASQQTGGRRKRKSQLGGRVSMPAEYFGGNSGAYSENPATCQHGYGPAPANSFGNNLGPCQPNTQLTSQLTGGSCGMPYNKSKPRSRKQSGGKRTKSKSKSKSHKKRSSKSKKRRSHSKKH